MKIASTAQRLRQILAEKNLKQADVIRLAKPYCTEYSQKLSRSDLSQFVSGKVTPGQWKLTLIALALNVSEAWLMGYDVPKDRQTSQSLSLDPFPAPQITEDYVEFPVIGDMAAGFEHIAAENWEGEKIAIPAQYLRGRPASDYIVLNVLGDSMYPFYLEGDKVLILRTPTLERSGQIGLVRYDGEMATLKKVEYVDGEDWVKLIPLNPMYQPREITGADLEQCSVIGVPKLIIRELE